MDFTRTGLDWGLSKQPLVFAIVEGSTFFGWFLHVCLVFGKLQGGPDSFLAISIRFFTEGIDSVRIGLRFLLVRFE